MANIFKNFTWHSGKKTVSAVQGREGVSGLLLVWGPAKFSKWILILIPASRGHFKGKVVEKKQHI